MKKSLVVGCVLGLLASTLSLAGERTVCALYFTDAGLTAQSSNTSLALTTLHGKACPADRLQTDGGILAWDGGYYLTLANGQPGDGGVAGCPQCNWGNVRAVALQCDNPVYVSEKPSGTVDNWGQANVTAATSLDPLIDFDINPDPYRIDFRGAGKVNHISVKPVGTSSNTCKLSTINRNVP